MSELGSTQPPPSRLFAGGYIKAQREGSGLKSHSKPLFGSRTTPPNPPRHSRKQKCPVHEQETLVRNPQHLLGSGTGFTNKANLRVSGSRQREPQGASGQQGAGSVTHLGLQRRPQLQTLTEGVCAPSTCSPQSPAWLMPTCACVPGHHHIL